MQNKQNNFQSAYVSLHEHLRTFTAALTFDLYKGNSYTFNVLHIYLFFTVDIIQPEQVPSKTRVKAVQLQFVVPNPHITPVLVQQ